MGHVIHIGSPSSSRDLAARAGLPSLVPRESVIVGWGAFLLVMAFQIVNALWCNL
jgi:hypothetical protein